MKQNFTGTLGAVVAAVALFSEPNALQAGSFTPIRPVVPIRIPTPVRFPPAPVRPAAPAKPAAPVKAVTPPPAPKAAAPAVHPAAQAETADAHPVSAHSVTESPSKFVHVPLLLHLNGLHPVQIPHSVHGLGSGNYLYSVTNTNQGTLKILSQAPLGTNTTEIKGELRQIGASTNVEYILVVPKEN